MLTQKDYNKSDKSSRSFETGMTLCWSVVEKQKQKHSHSIKVRGQGVDHCFKSLDCVVIFDMMISNRYSRCSYPNLRSYVHPEVSRNFNIQVICITLNGYPNVFI